MLKGLIHVQSDTTQLYVDTSVFVARQKLENALPIGHFLIVTTMTFGVAGVSGNQAPTSKVKHAIPLLRDVDRVLTLFLSL